MAKFSSNSASRELAPISQGVIPFIYNHYNNPNNYAMLFCKWQTVNSKQYPPIDLAPIFQGVILVNLSFVYKHHINPNYI